MSAPDRRMAADTPAKTPPSPKSYFKYPAAGFVIYKTVREETAAGNADHGRRLKQKSARESRRGKTHAEGFLKVQRHPVEKHPDADGGQHIFGYDEPVSGDAQDRLQVA